MSVHTVERYSVSKRKNTLAPATWVNREDAMLSEISQTQKSIPGGRKQAGVGARGWEEGGLTEPWARSKRCACLLPSTGHLKW